jgi:hypothetical protein
MATHAQQNCTKFAPCHKRDIESRTAQEFSENTLVKQYYLGV